jgi:hypothetical protein
MLCAAVVAGTAVLGTATAQAVEFGVYTRGSVAYVPPCPGPGYVWVAGYQANGYWIPGRWNFAGFRNRGPFVHFDRGPVFGRHCDRDRGHDRFRR